MTAFSTAPTPSSSVNGARNPWPATNEVPIVETFLGEIAVRTLDAAEFDLLMRSVDAVVRSGAFSRPLLQAALRISDQQAELMTSVLEALGLVSAGAPTANRIVNAQLEHLPLITRRLSGARVVR